MLQNPAQPCPVLRCPALYCTTGQPRKALDFYMIAAHLTPRDPAMWRRLATMSTDLAFYRQAIYCMGRVLRLEPGDLDARWDRAVLHAQAGNTATAIQQFEQARGVWCWC